MDFETRRKTVKILIKDEFLIQNWTELYDTLGLYGEVHKVYLMNECRRMNILSSELLNEILTKWIWENGSKATVENLTEILNDLGFRYVADGLKSEFSSSHRHNIFFENQNVIQNFQGRSKELDQFQHWFESPKLSKPEELDFVDNMEPLKVEVKPTVIGYTFNDVDAYKIDPKAGRYALIINNTEFFDEGRNRQGGEQDGRYMMELFQNLRYDCQYCPNVQSRELTGIINTFKSQFKTSRKADSCVVVIMSHGERDMVHMADNQPVNMWDQIVYQFDDTNSELTGIPKIFMFQTCQEWRTANDAVGIGKPKISDAIVCLATLPGTVARRDIFLGSWFIYCVTKVFMEHAYYLDFEELLKKVQLQMTKIRHREPLAQVCTWQSLLFKKFYFHP